MRYDPLLLRNSTSHIFSDMGCNGDPGVSRLHLRGLRILRQLKYLNLLILHPDLLLFNLAEQSQIWVRHLWRDILYRDTPHGQVIRTTLEGRVIYLGTGCVPIHDVPAPIKTLKNQPFLNKQPTMTQKLVATTRSFIQELIRFSFLCTGMIPRKVWNVWRRSGSRKPTPGNGEEELGELHPGSVFTCSPITGLNTKWLVTRFQVCGTVG